jgi:hypothetical protein
MGSRNADADANLLQLQLLLLPFALLNLGAVNAFCSSCSSSPASNRGARRASERNHGHNVERRLPTAAAAAAAGIGGTPFRVEGTNLEAVLDARLGGQFRHRQVAGNANLLALHQPTGHQRAAGALEGTIEVNSLIVRIHLRNCMFCM